MIKDSIQALHAPQEGVVNLPIPNGPIKEPFDGSRILATIPMYRYYWQLIWDNGDFRFQYEASSAGVITQTLFGKLPDISGVKEILVLDLFGHPDRPLRKVGIPEGAEPDILYQCCATMDGVAQPYRIYTFGWRRKNSGVGDYVHLHPSFDPPKILRSVRRTVSWSSVPKPQGANY